MGIRTAWQAIAQSPRRFLASSWPWRSLAYLLAGIAPSAAVAIGVLALVSAPAGRAAPVVLPLLAVAILLSGPVVARYERWRLRLLEPGGVLVTCSCSYNVDEAAFGQVVYEAADLEKAEKQGEDPLSKKYIDELSAE